MNAKLKQTYRWGSVQIGGIEVVKTEFRQLPDALCKLHAGILEFETKPVLAAEDVKLPINTPEIKPEVKVEVKQESAEPTPEVIQPPVEQEFKRKSKYSKE